MLLFLRFIPFVALKLAQKLRNNRNKENFLYFFQWTLSTELSSHIDTYLYWALSLHFIQIRLLCAQLFVGAVASLFSLVLHQFSATCKTHKIYSMSHSLKPFYLSSSDCLENSFPWPSYNLSFAHQNYKCDCECRQLGNKRNAEYATMQKEMMNGKRSQNTKIFHRKLLLFQQFLYIVLGFVFVLRLLSLCL